MGYETERFIGTINDNLICSICQEVLEDPMECSECQTNFCSACIALWMTKSKICPNRCDLKLQRSHRFVRSELEKLQISCVNKDFGCEILLKLEFLKQHEDRDCFYRRISCINEGCMEKFLVSERENHEQSCVMRIISCFSCNSKFKFFDQKAHSCISVLSDLIKDLSNASENLDNGLRVLSHTFSENSYHFGIKCNECQTSPISGTRYICLSCPDYSLCWKCYNLRKHQHTNMLQLNKDSFHEDVICDGCRINPITGLRYKCKVCENFDFCQKCRFTTPHNHNDFYIWAPYTVTVKPLPYFKYTIKTGDEIIRSWSIYNEGCEILTGFFISCIGGDCCTNSPYYEFQGIEINPKESREIFIRDIVTQCREGLYRSEWRLATHDRVSPFGPTLSYEVFVLNR
ncbi:hypothetical protein SteCoe_13472 [Stentor coeruleus]|uniref:RING-type domain-containing protein n=1 Tax=Stentor coeruleus TaxID=5963 RepID=A0A1R2C8B4_9CILI|nr:hypothetical protein SteCoe_13472 [Stentor coeruleus]